MNRVAEIWRSPFPSQEFDDAPEVKLKYEELILSYRVEGKPFEIRFRGIVAFCFTQFRACRKEHLAAYDKLVALGESEWIREIMSATQSVEGTHHYRIFIDDVGCYDVIARAVETPD